MTISELKEILSAEIVVDGGKTAEGVYVGDFLSRVMGKAPAGCVWLTIMNNVNVAGVATLAEIGAIVLCEGVKPTPELTERCRDESISLMTTDLSAYDACLRLGN